MRRNHKILDQLEQDLIILNLEEIQDFDKAQPGNAKIFVVKRINTPVVVWHTSLNKGGWEYYNNETKGFRSWAAYNINDATEFYYVEEKISSFVSKYTWSKIKETVIGINPSKVKL
jgi:hypothetical protein